MNMMKFVPNDPTDYMSERIYEQSGTKPNLVAKILATNIGNCLCIGYQNW